MAQGKYGVGAARGWGLARGGLGAVAAAGLLLLVLPSAARAVEPPAAVGAVGPTTVRVGIHVVSVRELDARGMTFQADFYLWAHHPADARVAGKIPEIEFTNAVEPVELGPPIWDVVEGAERYVCWHVQAAFAWQPALHHYPFDCQTLEIEIEHDELETDRMVFTDDVGSYSPDLAPRFWGAQPDMQVPEFTLVGTRRRVEETVYPTTFGDPDRAGSTRYSRYVLSLDFRRDSLPYFLKILLPILVILAMAYMVFWVPAEEISTSSGLALTALLAIIASNVSVSQSLPNVGYLVVSDWFFLATYLLLIAAMGASVLLCASARRGEHTTTHQWTVWWRWAFPIGAFLLLGGLAAVGMAC